MENTNIFERIMQLAVVKGFKNIPDLATYMGYDSAEKLYRLKRKPDANPSYDIVEDFTNKFEDLNIRWFISGKGKMLISANNYADTRMPTYTFDIQKEGVNADTPTPKSTPNVKNRQKAAPPTAPPTPFFTPKYITVDKAGTENILFVPVRAAAGYLNGYQDREYIENLPAFSLPQLKNGTFRAFEIDGDSMSPTLENKETIIGKYLESIDNLREDYVHIVVTKNKGVIVKRLLNRIEKYGYIIAKSDAFDNRSLYTDMEIYPDDILEIWIGVAHINFKFKHPTDMYKRINNMEANLTEVMRILRQSNLLS